LCLWGPERFFSGVWNPESTCPLFGTACFQDLNCGLFPTDTDRLLGRENLIGHVLTDLMGIVLLHGPLSLRLKLAHRA